MNLLLLLSALFSALAGIGGGVRAPNAVQAVAGAVATPAATVKAAFPAPSRPVAALPSISTTAGDWPIVAAPLVAVAIPLWADRRRE
ncbi:hypothetical protein [Sphingomonas sp. 1P08PE]|uniref:hypothetical protein n=1 Tax=Sphingomonas sp. 1P08PE TaxID=554122 RepID=UPI0039A2A08B